MVEAGGAGATLDLLMLNAIRRALRVAVTAPVLAALRSIEAVL